MFVGIPKKQHRKYLEQVGLKFPYILKLNDDEVIYETSHSKAQHPEESWPDAMARAVARVAYKKYGKANIWKRITLLFTTIIIASTLQAQVNKTDITKVGGTAVSGGNVVDGANNAFRVNVVAGGAGGGVAQLQVRNSGDTAWVNVGFNVANLTLPVTLQNSSIAVTGTFWQNTQPISGTVSINAIPTGGNVIGHVIADTGSTTAVTGNVTVVQPTGTNLHTVCDSGCSSAASFVDNAAFTIGTTTLTNVGGTFNDSATNLTAGNAGVFRLTTDRMLFGNIGKINGVVPLMGNGITGTGSLRVTIASDNTAFATNATLQSGSTTAVTQATGTNLHAVIDSGSTTAVTGNVTAVQATGTNLHTVVDSGTITAVTGITNALPAGTNVIGHVIADTGSTTAVTSLPANASVNLAQMAGSTLVADPCMVNARSVANVNLTAGGTLITGVSAKQTYICYLQFSIGAAADNIALVEGTGTVCATGIAGMAGGTTAATGWNLLANGSVTSGTISNWAFKTATAADNVCLLASSSAQISGTLQYVQQ